VSIIQNVFKMRMTILNKDLQNKIDAYNNRLIADATRGGKIHHVYMNHVLMRSFENMNDAQHYMQSAIKQGEKSFYIKTI